VDFDDTPAEAELRAECRRFLDQHAKLRTGPLPSFGVRDEAVIAEAKRWMAKKAEAGFSCMTWPEEYGGRGATRIEAAIFAQEEARYDVPPNVFSIGQGMLGPAVITHGTHEQKQRYLPKLRSGEDIWCQLFSEPGAGSDLAGLRTRAEPDGDDFIVNGQKIWTSGAHFSEWGLLLTRTSQSAVKHKGITYFIINMKSPGIEIRQIRQINGSANFNEVFFTDVRVPSANIIGRYNEGWRGAITTLMNERAVSAGAEMGFAEAMLRTAVAVDIDGQPALQDPAFRQRIADFYIRERGVKLAGLRSLTRLSRGENPGPEGSIGKLVGAALRQEMAAFALDLLGPLGAVSDPAASPLEAMWPQAFTSTPGGRIAGGTDEVMRNILAERVLGLPADVRADKELPFNQVPTGKRR
jgi:acyl-CoA dehydrogenase